MLDDPEIEALDREFNAPDSTMRVETYAARREEIRARPPQTRESAPVPAISITPAPVAVVPKAPQISAEKRAEIKSINAKFNAAMAANNPDEMLAIIKTDAFRDSVVAAAHARIERHAGAAGDPASVLLMFFLQMEVSRAGDIIQKARRKQLEARVAALEDFLPLAYGGTWSEGQQSNKGIFYTDRGAVWYCRESTQERPGASACFQLAVKAGRDGKDAR